MLEVELVSTTDGAFYKASEVVILEQLWAGALFKHILARIHTKQRQEIPFTHLICIWQHFCQSEKGNVFQPTTLQMVYSQRGMRH